MYCSETCRKVFLPGRTKGPEKSGSFSIIEASGGGSVSMNYNPKSVSTVVYYSELRMDEQTGAYYSQKS
jgi:hypothetical protein